MKCYYEVLGVARDANGDDLKRSYRKLALQWHPDKNPDNSEEATEQFRIIQQAYEVLIDPQERAWYDRHREAILKGGVGENYTDDSLDVFQYFNSGCYTGYNDSEKGFYTVFRNVFKQLATEDLEFCDDDQSLKNRETAPTFGCSTDTYEEVGHAFYAYWQSYCTMKTYTWLDKYDIREAPNRRVLRLMEKENKKIREQSRRKRNEEIRALVAFVRKRDKRVQAHKKLLAEKAAENERKAEENRRRQLNERRKCLETYQESDWSAMSQVEDMLQEMEANIATEFGENGTQNSDDDNSSDDDAINLDLYCIACDKEFKSAKAFTNHEQSKKHRENAAILKQTMQEEENEFVESRAAENDEVDAFSESVSESEEFAQMNKRKQKKLKKKNRKVVDIHLVMSEEEVENVVAESLQKVEINDEQSEDTLVIHEVEEPKNTISTEKKEKTKAKKAKEKKKIPKEPAATAAITREDPEDELTCSVCHTQFPSRNKLFDHLKKTGHAVAIGHGTNLASKGKNGKNSRKR